MRRREVLGLMGAVPAFPISALAQPSRRIVKIGHMESGSPSDSPELLVAFRERLRELGYVEGQNLFIERRYADGRSEHLPTLAAELVRFSRRCYFCHWSYRSPGGGKRDENDPDRLCRRWRSGRNRPREEHGPARRERNRTDTFRCRACGQAARVAEERAPCGYTHRGPSDSEQH